MCAAKFGQFTDVWVVEKVLFQYVSGGNCSCCGVSVTHNLANLYEACSDLSENPNQIDENESPWPAYLMNEVWEDKIKIRQRLKLESKKYQKFWAEHEKEFRLFWAQMPIENKRKLFQMPQEELHSMIAQENDFKEAYRVLMLALVEQLRYWEKTLYPSDAVSASEVAFEKYLLCRPNTTTFIVSDDYLQCEDGQTTADGGGGEGSQQEGFIARFAELCGPKLLYRRGEFAAREKKEKTKKKVEDAALSMKLADASLEDGEEEAKKEVDVMSEDEDSDSEDEETREDKDTPPAAKPKQSAGEQLLFKSDRRLLRVMIYRYFASNVMHAFKKQLAQQPPKEKVAQPENPST